MKITKKILFPTDFSIVAENAFIYALSLGEQIKAEIQIVHIVPIFESGEAENIQVHPFMKTANQHLEICKLEEFKKEQERLEQLVSILHKEHIHLKFSFLKGEFLDVIVDLIECQHVDMVIMGTSGANTIDKKLFGSNAMNIITNTEIPVMAIPSKAKFTSISNYCMAVMLEPEEIFTIRQIANYLSLLELPMSCVNIVSSPQMLLIAERKRQEWMQNVNYSNVTVDIIINNDVSKGLLGYARDNEIDLLGILHRNLPITKRLFSINHSKLFLKQSQTALLIYNI